MFSAEEKLFWAPGPPFREARPPLVAVTETKSSSPVSSLAASATCCAAAAMRRMPASVRSKGVPSGIVSVAEMLLPSICGKKMKRTCPFASRLMQRMKNASARPAVA